MLNNFLKIGGNPNNQASSVSWLPVNPNAPELTVLREAMQLMQHYFQLVFFACGVHKLNCINYIIYLITL